MTKLVLLALADHANSDGKCWPGLNALSKKTGASYRTVQRQIDTLDSQGHIGRQVIAGKGTTYSVHPRHSDTPDTVTPGSGDVTPLSESHSTPDTVAPLPGHSDTQTVIEPESNRKEPSSPPTPQGGLVEAEAITFSDFIIAWNGLAQTLKRPPLEAATRKRVDSVEKLIASYSHNQLERAFRNAMESDWLSKSQVFTFDWFIQPDNFVKVLEGNYNLTPTVRKSRDGFVNAIDRQAASTGGYGDTDMDDELEAAGYQIVGRKSPRRNGGVSIGDALKNVTPLKAARG